MIYGLLAPDVPLGPFEGSPITVWSAQGKQAKLHASSSCSYLRSARATEREVYLGASVVARMCPQCGAYSSWARPGTGLAVFLDTLTGLGLLYELDSFRDADEDAFGDEEVPGRQQPCFAGLRPTYPRTPPRGTRRRTTRTPRGRSCRRLGVCARRCFVNGATR
ncbi:hypothetical protein WKI65_38425 [Streptomyces sp. MS1.AVA.3]|uniref:hypothetical protein n=1 Tax=Streptomyces decoyicus TaxID=249567 RepID=UPI0030C07CC6